MARQPLPIHSAAVISAREQIKSAEDELIFKKLDEIAFGKGHRVLRQANGLGHCEWCDSTVPVGDEPEECPMNIIWEVMES